MEKEALIVLCPRTKKPESQVYWTHFKSKKNITTSKGNRIYSSGVQLKFLPTSLNDSGIYNCTIKSPKGSFSGYVNITIYPKQHDCKVPQDLLYMPEEGTYIKSMIHCPTIELYDEIVRVDWFKNCKALKGQGYYANKDYLIIKNPTAADAGIYTCKFIYSENGINYNVTASKPFIFQGINVSVVCRVCLGKGMQIIEQVAWCIKKKNVINCIKNPRFHEENEAPKSNENLNCKTVTLRITNVKREDLSLEFYCWALNEHGFKEHSIRIRMKKTNGKIYDAYVIYPRNYQKRTEIVNSMEYFVHQILPEVLENKCGYSLCIYGRDLLPGEDAASEMVKCIQKSRRQIIILNPQVEHGEEFAYEQEIALHCALMQNDSKVILIEMETTGDTKDLQDSLKHIIKQQGTIQWKGDHVTNKQSFNSHFWKHLRYLMPARSKSLDPLHSGK
ncbi:interleukin-1 receptor-like 1 isoform X3 [Sminthopsis crassicaudata]|uniref:interleukin-1 receptor-like 1 isoform X3 n=1 Tax=Sminthopsis crassicaudata TaxID=9301 RepID=UPI003D6804A9